ncbi:hypothetical protein [uncultured Buchnera sp.]|uniref:hypothetical protein n=1 Tax=uncultured Buchnera sp. TaxID=574037 RepID=UPI0025E856A9|nr:hypothetical protein [uncultured Buchnera sp.]
MESLNAVKNTVLSAYETIKNETINLFNGTTFLKIFDAGCALFSEPTESTKETSKKIDHLMEQVEELNKTIESSKFFIHTIIEKVKEQGRLKIVNKLNNNPNHPEYESFFPDLHVMVPKKENLNTWYPFNLDESFDIEVREGTLKVNQKFKDRMNRTIEKSHYKYFTDHNVWTVSDKLDLSPENVFSTMTHFQKIYEKLKSSSQELNEDFMTDFHSSLFVIDGNLIHSTNKEDMIEKFKKIVPNIMDQKLISAYAHPKILKQSYLQLLSEHPEINQYQIINSRNIYTITHIDNNQIKLVATNLSNLRSKDKNSTQPYYSFGIRTSIILPSKNSPTIKFSHFMH